MFSKFCNFCMNVKRIQLICCSLILVSCGETETPRLLVNLIAPVVAKQVSSTKSRALLENETILPDTGVLLSFFILVQKSIVVDGKRRKNCTLKTISERHVATCKTCRRKNVSFPVLFSLSPPRLHIFTKLKPVLWFSLLFGAFCLEKGVPMH